MVNKIEDFVKELCKTNTSLTVAGMLDISIAMVSNYKTGNHLPSLAVAIRIYQKFGKVMHPFSEDSIKHEIKVQAL